MPPLRRLGIPESVKKLLLTVVVELLKLASQGSTRKTKQNVLAAFRLSLSFEILISGSRKGSPALGWYIPLSFTRVWDVVVTQLSSSQSKLLVSSLFCHRLSDCHSPPSTIMQQTLGTSLRRANIFTPVFFVFIIIISIIIIFITLTILPPTESLTMQHLRY